jgi:hypothetical protein
VAVVAPGQRLEPPVSTVLVVLAAWTVAALPVAIVVGRVLRDGHGPDWKERT